MNKHDEVVSLEVTAGIISHLVVVADQGPVDGADREGQQLFVGFQERSGKASLCRAARPPLFPGAGDATYVPT